MPIRVSVDHHQVVTDLAVKDVCIKLCINMGTPDLSKGYVKRWDVMVQYYVTVVACSPCRMYNLGNDKRLKTLLLKPWTLCFGVLNVKMPVSLSKWIYRE